MANTYTFTSVTGGSAKYKVNGGLSHMIKDSDWLDQLGPSIIRMQGHNGTYDMDTAVDTIVVNGTTVTGGASTMDTIFDALNPLFRKANSGTGGTGTATTDASALTTGTLNDARLSATVTKQGNTYVNILLNGVLQNGTNQATNIQSLIGSNKTLYFPYGTNGTYNLTAAISISGVSNLKIYADKGVTLTTTGSKVFDISGNVSNLEILGFKLVSTRNSTTELDDGVISIYNFGASTANITGLNIHDNEITAPNSFQNGIKLIAESAGFMSQLKVTDNYIHHIQRLGIEFQNSISNTIYSYYNYEVSRNTLHDISTNQTGAYNGVAISMAGGGRNGVISRNNIYDVLSTSGGKVGAGIEVAGNTDVVISNNVITSKNNGFSGIIYTNLVTQNRYDASIVDNVIDLQGTESGQLLIWGISAYYSKGLKISGNKVKSSGYGLYFLQCSENFITDNDFYCLGTRVITFGAGSANNVIYGNKVDNTAAASNDGLINFDGSGVTGNKVKYNVLRMKSDAGGDIVEANGATGNDVSQRRKVRTITTDFLDILPTDEFLIYNTPNGNAYFPSPGNYYGAVEQELYIKNISTGTLTLNNNIATGQKIILQSQEGMLFKNNGTSYYAITQVNAVTPRIQSVTSAATVTPDASNDAVKVTAQAAALTLANPTGTFSPMQAMIIRIKDNGTARAITYGTQYRAIGVTIPTTTVVSKTLYLGMIWNSDDTKWDVTGYSIEA